MKIKVEKSGGFAGISTTNEIDTNRLPCSLEGTVKELLDTRKLPLTKGLKRLKGAADYFTYKITIRDGNKDHVIECDQFDIHDRLKSLIAYVEKQAKK